jgi:hypothetical protein
MRGVRSDLRFGCVRSVRIRNIGLRRQKPWKCQRYHQGKYFAEHGLPPDEISGDNGRNHA